MGKVFEKREVKCYNFSIKERGKLVNMQNKKHRHIDRRISYKLKYIIYVGFKREMLICSPYKTRGRMGRYVC